MWKSLVRKVFFPAHESLMGRRTLSVVGDLQRIRLYPEKGFQIRQEIPDDVWAAYEVLVDSGYDRYLAK